MTEINKVAILGGTCSSEIIYDAIKNDCDILITGEIAHHNAVFANSEGQNIILCTHFMENIFIDKVADDISKLGIEAVINLVTNPIVIKK
jgi:putative NIF3 family GTP cyclohydrolase 1 type 2